MGYKRFIRILEGNKQLAASIGAFFKRRDKITRTQWEKVIRPLMKQTENDILTTLKSNDLSQWNIFNLNRIQQSVRTFIQRFDSQFKTALVEGQKVIGDFAMSAVDDNLKWVGLKGPGTMIQSENVLASMFPLSEGFVEFFTSDIAKIVNAEISLGLINQQSVNKVAGNIRDKFISSQMSFARAELIARTELLRASSIAEHARGLEIAELNPDMRKVWLSSHKADFKPEHLKAEQRYTTNPIPIKQKFVVGGETCLFPRDYSLSAKNVCNCGCSTAYVNKTNLDGVNGLGDDIKPIGKGNTIDSINKNLKDKLGLKDVNFGGMPIELASIQSDELIRLSGKYKNKLTRINCKEFKSNINAKVVAQGNLTYNLKKFNSYDDYIKMKTSNINASWNPSINIENYGISTSTHEFAHTIVNTEVEKMYKSEFAKSLKNIKTRYSRNLTAIKNEYGVSYDSGGSSFQLRNTSLTKGEESIIIEKYRKAKSKIFISDYAKENSDEFMAEAFMQAELSDNPSPYAIEVKELIKKWYGR